MMRSMVRVAVRRVGVVLRGRRQATVMRVRRAVGYHAGILAVTGVRVLGVVGGVVLHVVRHVEQEHKNNRSRACFSEMKTTKSLQYCTHLDLSGSCRLVHG